MGATSTALLHALAKAGDTLVFDQSDRAPGHIRRLTPGFAAEALGLAKGLVHAQGETDLTMAQALCTPVAHQTLGGQSDRLASAVRAVQTLLSEPPATDRPCP